MKYVKNDITNILRIKSITNYASYIGFILCFTYLMFGIAINRWFVLVVLFMIIASLQVRKGSITAGAVQLLIAFSIAGLFLHEYQLTPQKIGALDLSDNLKRSTISSLRRSNLLFFFIFAGCSVFFSIGMISNIFLKKKYPLIFRRTGEFKEWKHEYGRLLSKKKNSTLFFGGLGLIFAIVFMAPFLWIILLFFFKSPIKIKYLDFFNLLEDLPDNPGLFFIKFLIIFAAGIAATKFFIKAKRLASFDVSEIRKTDTRPPILLLRSFQDDITTLSKSDDPKAWIRSLLFRQWWTLEETLEDALWMYGPVIAIGRPGEKLPPAGAAREYVPNESWRERVKEHIKESQFIVIILGKTEGLEFEYRILAELNALGKLVILFPPVHDTDLEERWERFSKTALNQEESIPQGEVKRTLVAYLKKKNDIMFVTSNRNDDEDCYRLAVRWSINDLISI